MTMTTIIFAHGAEERDPNYAQVLINRLVSALPEVKLFPFFYGDILQAHQDGIIAGLRAGPQYRQEHLKGIRGVVNEFVMDALQVNYYMYEIQKRFREQFNDWADYHVVAHSMGGWVAQEMGLFPAAKSITTLGCALHWFNMPGHTYDQKVVDKWSNFWHSDDFIGCPLNGLYGINDIEMKDAGPPTWLLLNSGVLFSIAAHMSYMKSRKVADHIIQQVRKAK